MQGRSILVLMFLFIQISTGATATVLFNPHEEPARCVSCHVRIPTGEEAARQEYSLLRDSIDASCNICHDYTCCKPGMTHREHHPSDVSKWDTEKFTPPRTLPLYRGYITCNTCHFHRRPEGPGFKMVRIVKILEDKVDWTGLCKDCHIDY